MLNETIANGLNNPDCAFFVGNFLGNYTSFRWVLALIGAYFVFKAVDTLAFKPLLDFIKKSLKRKKKKVKP